MDMSEKKKRKIFPLLFSIGGLILLVLFVLFIVMKKNNAQQEVKRVTVDLNGEVTALISSLSDASNADLLPVEGELPSLTPASQSSEATVIAALTLGSEPEKIVALPLDLVSDHGLSSRETVSSVAIYDRVVRFYFALNKANVADGSRNALDKLINEAKGKRYLVIAPFYEETEKGLLDDKLLQQQVLNIWKVLEDAGVATEKRIILKPQAQLPDDENYAAGTHIDVFTVQGDHYPAEDRWPISLKGQ